MSTQIDRVPALETRGGKTAIMVARTLVRMILGENWAAGDRLPAEREMAAQLGIARATLREALRLLEAQGFIRIKVGTGGGPIVTVPSTSVLSGNLVNIFAVYGATVDDVFVARKQLEPTVARIAAEKHKLEDIRDLEELVERPKDSVRGQILVMGEHFFHERLAEIAGNPVLRIIVSSLQGVSDANTLGMPSAGRESERVVIRNFHKAILDAVKQGDGDEAYTLMYKHLDRVHESIRADYPGLLRQELKTLI